MIHEVLLIHLPPPLKLNLITCQSSLSCIKTSRFFFFFETPAGREKTAHKTNNCMDLSPFSMATTTDPAWRGSSGIPSDRHTQKLELGAGTVPGGGPRWGSAGLEPGLSGGGDRWSSTCWFDCKTRGDISSSSMELQTVSLLTEQLNYSSSIRCLQACCVQDSSDPRGTAVGGCWRVRTLDADR